MKSCLTFALALILLAGCKKEKEETTTTVVTEAPAEAVPLSFEQKSYTKKSTICQKKCSYVDIKIEEALGGDGLADSINNAVFRVVRSIVYFGEKPTNAKNYDELTSKFIQSYDDLAKKYPEEAAWNWEAEIKATKEYQSENIINFKVNNYMFTGGAHGYEGNRSVIIDAKTGRTLKRSDILKDEKGFTSFAEKAFRKKFGIPAGKLINSGGMMFENNRFALPQNIFYADNGLLLLYNPVEISSFADGAKKLEILYSEAEPYLKIK